MSPHGHPAFHLNFFGKECFIGSAERCVRSQDRALRVPVASNFRHKTQVLAQSSPAAAGDSDQGDANPGRRPSHPDIRTSIGRLWKGLILSEWPLNEEESSLENLNPAEPRTPVMRNTAQEVISAQDSFGTIPQQELASASLAERGTEVTSEAGSSGAWGSDSSGSIQKLTLDNGTLIPVTDDVSSSISVAQPSLDLLQTGLPSVATSAPTPADLAPNSPYEEGVGTRKPALGALNVPTPFQTDGSDEVRIIESSTEVKEAGSHEWGQGAPGWGVGHTSREEEVGPVLAGSQDAKESARARPVQGPMPWESRFLRLEGVCKVYGNKVAVEGVSVELRPGEVVGLLGPNGAGKSTAFSILSGREWPTSGRVLLGNDDVTGLPLEGRARMGVGYLPQESSIFRGLSVRDNIRLVLQESGAPWECHDSRINAILTQFGLHSVANSLGKQLSGGERRRAELARALAAPFHVSDGPGFLLVDEPFAGVDPIGVQELQDILEELRSSQGFGIFITDHNVREALRICDRAYVMNHGMVKVSGTPEDLCKDPYVIDNYLGRYFEAP